MESIAHQRQPRISRESCTNEPILRSRILSEPILTGVQQQVVMGMLTRIKARLSVLITGKVVGRVT